MYVRAKHVKVSAVKNKYYIKKSLQVDDSFVLQTVTLFVETLARSAKPHLHFDDAILENVCKLCLVSNSGEIVTMVVINPSAWGHLNPSSYCDVGRLFYGVFKLWSKLQRKK